MKRKLKTMTLFQGDNPSTVICPGHVDQKTFNEAHKNEGWSPGGGYRQKDLVYGYRYTKKFKKGTRFTICPPSKKGAKPFTWTSWDQ